MIEVKGDKLTHNFELLRNTNISLTTLSRAPYSKANLTGWGGRGGRRGLPACFSPVQKNKIIKND